MMSARRKPPTEDTQTAVFDKRRPSEDERRRAVELTTPTQVDDVPSQPIRVISMKTPAELAAEKRDQLAKNHVVQLRAMSEVNRNDTPTNLGRLAPPRDPAGARKRRLRELVIWGSAVLLVASVVTLGIWLIAR